MAAVLFNFLGKVLVSQAVGGGGGDTNYFLILQIFPKANLLPIENDSEKEKIGKNYKVGQIPQKMLVTLLLTTSCSA